MAAALALGADGVWVGTRLVATDEAFARSDYKRRILSAVPGDTYCRRVRLPQTDVAVRVLPAPPVTGEHAIKPPADDVILREQLRLPTADADGTLADLLLLAGESAALIHDIRPAREVIRRMHTEALVVLHQRLQPLAVPRLARRTARTSPSK
jgi:NAD(P)H-dependent flavin oxidoreductase YrpB (nitropropane dioxygenase family)